MEELKDNIKMLEKEEKTITKLVEELKNKERSMQESITRLQDNN